MDQGKGAKKRMKQDIHPNYQPVVFMDSTTGFKFLSGSTKGSSETVEWEDGNTYPLLRVEVTSDSHPFYTGRQIHTSRRTCGPFQQKIRSQRRKRKSRRIVFQNIVMTRFIEVFHCGGKPLFLLDRQF